MFFRSIAAAFAGCVVLLSSLSVSSQTQRGPSTPEERKQALEKIHSWQSDPLGPQAKDQFGWVLRWLADVPDVTVHVCTVLDKLPKGDKKDSATIFGGEFMGQAEFVIENPDKKDDRQAEYVAGVESALRVYELVLKRNPRDRQPFLDEVLQRRDAGTLGDYVRERAAASCKN